LVSSRAGGLQPGDYLIADNASIHFAASIRAELLSVLSSFGVGLVFLPAYSPELNPCELVVAYVKSFLRRHRVAARPLREEIARAFDQVDVALVTGWYLHCILHPFVAE